MARLKYEDWIEEDPFHPCFTCGEKEFHLEDDIYKCSSCGKPLETTHPKKKAPKVIRKMKDDWE
jgi:ribosomal protein L37E